MATKKKSRHHYWWPKRKFPGKRHRCEHVFIDNAVHAAYHQYFLNECRRTSDRRCFNEFCQYEGICCYKQSIDTF